MAGQYVFPGTRPATPAFVLATGRGVHDLRAGVQCKQANSSWDQEGLDAGGGTGKRGEGGTHTGWATATVQEYARLEPLLHASARRQQKIDLSSQREASGRQLGDECDTLTTKELRETLMHGVCQGGPLRTPFNCAARPTTTAEALRMGCTAGIPEIDNFNDWRRSQAGYGEFQLNFKDGNKHSDELAPGGEVVLCAGSIHLPQILQLSSIRPQAISGKTVLLSLWTSLASARTSQSEPDLQIRFVPSLAPRWCRLLCHVRKTKDSKWPSGLTFQLLGVRPKSRGSVSHRSDDPWDAPQVDIGFLNDKQVADLATLRSGMKRPWQTAAQSFVASELHPGALASLDTAIDAFIRDTVHSGYANVGTCSMAAAPGGNAVVDPSLCVFGVWGLRVADASVIPAIPGGQTRAATVMVAERAAHILLGSGAQQPSGPELAAQMALA
ncbi:hypothetical protein WJX75_000937 [Coccomyxa subellipsoidea]|uniref:Glucose-methanol-choline oxidoreductase C-terminal domain-containing protein n=1 Tax=Coccomyxa subellipsoidea TaxID=248742 RepID=A0ABR2YUN1_9CHLO